MSNKRMASLDYSFKSPDGQKIFSAELRRAAQVFGGWVIHTYICAWLEAHGPQGSRGTGGLVYGNFVNLRDNELYKVLSAHLPPEKLGARLVVEGLSVEDMAAVPMSLLIAPDESHEALFVGLCADGWFPLFDEDNTPSERSLTAHVLASMSPASRRFALAVASAICAVTDQLQARLADESLRGMRWAASLSQEDANRAIRNAEAWKRAESRAEEQYKRVSPQDAAGIDARKAAAQYKHAVDHLNMSSLPLSGFGLGLRGTGVGGFGIRGTGVGGFAGGTAGLGGDGGIGMHGTGGIGSRMETDPADGRYIFGTRAHMVHVLGEEEVRRREELSKREAHADLRDLGRFGVAGVDAGSGPSQSRDMNGFMVGDDVFYTCRAPGDNEERLEPTPSSADGGRCVDPLDTYIDELCAYRPYAASHCYQDYATASGFVPRGSVRDLLINVVADSLSRVREAAPEGHNDPMVTRIFPGSTPPPTRGGDATPEARYERAINRLHPRRAPTPPVYAESLTTESDMPKPPPKD